VAERLKNPVLKNKTEDIHGGGIHWQQATNHTSAILRVSFLGSHDLFIR